MKKLCMVCMIGMVLLLSCGCEKTYHAGSEELEARIRQEIPHPNADTIELNYAAAMGQINSFGKIMQLNWVHCINEEESFYLAIELEQIRDTGRKFVAVHEPAEIVKDIWALEWQGNYAFLVNNKDCVMIRTIDAKDVVRDFEITHDIYPMPYYTALENQYMFLDADGNEIR